ncbi:MAG: hypothetical protein FWC47_05230 [Oscillospiraceae bacterium]|nr:hypothetical protein [Oscillospiraceae bacterium]
MDKISTKITFMLENGMTKDIVIKDLISSCTESELYDVANTLIKNKCNHNGSLFKSVEKILKITTTEEKF